MFGDFHLTIVDVEDLSSGADGWRAVLKMRAAARTGFGSMTDELVGLRDLPERGSAMAELTAGLESRLLSEASGARGLLPRRIK